MPYRTIFGLLLSLTNVFGVNSYGLTSDGSMGGGLSPPSPRFFFHYFQDFFQNMLKNIRNKLGLSLAKLSNLFFKFGVWLGFAVKDRLSLRYGSVRNLLLKHHPNGIWDLGIWKFGIWKFGIWKFVIWKFIIREFGIWKYFRCLLIDHWIDFIWWPSFFLYRKYD